MNSLVYLIFALGGYFMLLIVIYNNRNVLFKNIRKSLPFGLPPEKSERKPHSNKQYLPAEQMPLNDNKLELSNPFIEKDRTPSLFNGNIRQQQLVYKLNDYILENKTVMTIALDRDKLASALSTNRTTLSKSVRDVTGKTLMEYINLLRLEKTVNNLDNPAGLTLEAIAEAYGFTYRKFYRHFREHYHCTPSEYRKMAGCPSTTNNQTANA